MRVWLKWQFLSSLWTFHARLPSVQGNGARRVWNMSACWGCTQKLLIAEPKSCSDLVRDWLFLGFTLNLDLQTLEASEESEHWTPTTDTPNMLQQNQTFLKSIASCLLWHGKKPPKSFPCVQVGFGLSILGCLVLAVKQLPGMRWDPARQFLPFEGIQPHLQLLSCSSHPAEPVQRFQTVRSVLYNFTRSVLLSLLGTAGKTFHFHTEKHWPTLNRKLLEIAG